MSGIGSFFSSMFTTHADAPEDKPAPETEQPAEDASAEEAPKEEEKEEDEPEDAHPEIRAACESSASCAPLKHHFEKCQEKVQAGEGFKGEDCVDEIMMHCSEACAAPKVFSKLR
ncbi:Non-heme 11 kDa protein of cytochrome bc1 complex [Mycena leptocephala]|nr:Non-heme 11 kDa protein of cytochrome bc1 complex [Mycena leptocephala]